MNAQSTEDNHQDRLIGQVVEEYFRLVELGQAPLLDDLVKSHPEIADVLRTVIPAMQATNVDTNSRPTEPRQLGDFRILHQIGRGGMGIVYRAEQISMRRQVALKVLPLLGLADEVRIQRFQNEVRAVASLDHPRIVSIYSVGEERGTHYFAMQLIDGCSLDAVIHSLRQARNGDSLPEGNASQIAGSLEAGLDSDATEAQVVSHSASSETSLRKGDYSLPQQDRSTYFRSVAALGIQAAEALQHAHDRRVVHRDVYQPIS